MQPDTKPLGLGKKFILSALGILLYMGLYALLFLPILLLDGDAFVIATIAWGVGAFVLYFPWFLWMTKKIWFFPGEGHPLTLDEVRKEVLVINHHDLPITVEEKSPTHLVITWKYVDAKWWEIFRKAGMAGAYRLHVKLDPVRHEASLIDVTTSMNWDAGPSGFHAKWTFVRGIIMQVSLGKAWGIRENFTLGKIYDFKFVPEEIKNPVMNTLLRCGWNVRFALF